MANTEILHAGNLYFPGDPEIDREQRQYQELLYDYNQTHPTDMAKRGELLQRMFASIGEGCCIEPPLRANWAGHHVHVGKGVYANFNLTLVDDTWISIGDYTMIGPNVTIATAGHPILPELRDDKQLQYNQPVSIGRNCWLGAGVIVLPGVTIGENSVIGAGSVVTKDIPAGVVAVGNPCRVLRPIGEKDRQFFWRDRPIDPSLLGENHP